MLANFRNHGRQRHTQVAPHLLEITGDDGNGRDSGEDAEAVINGIARTGDGSTFGLIVDASASDFEAAVSELNVLIAEAGSTTGDAGLFEPDPPTAAAREQATRAAIVREQFAVYSRQQPQWAPTQQGQATSQDKLAGGAPL